MKNTGFTLIEIIASLLLMSLIVLTGGLGVLKLTEGFLFAQQNAEFTQHVQTALNRLEKELREFIGITAATPTALTLTQLDGSHAIAYNPATDTITINNQNQPLLENVSSFTISYYSGDDPWNFGDDIRELSSIQINFQVSPASDSDTTIDFEARVSPRNNNNYGGAPPGSVPPSLPSFSACFIASCTGPPLMQAGITQAPWRE